MTPKYLHSNATSHKWVLGAIAELLDNAVDEIEHGCTFVAVDIEYWVNEGNPCKCDPIGSSFNPCLSEEEH